ncbi:MAG: ATP-binding cassette domain-containing protein [Spirochaetia bacterium]|nr:ATP-binding cassette domain-containing protein [Spirochaetia bacterium]
MITIDRLSKSYRTVQGPLEVFNEFSLDLEEGRITAILGPSGCGKTTLLHMIAQMEGYDSGAITGVPRSGTTSVASLSYLFQEPRLLPWMTVFENVDLVLQNHLPDRHERHERADQFIELVGLSGYAHLTPKELSGGMKQRAAIARAFAYPSQLILMDEPFQSLDADLRFQLIAAYGLLWQHNPRTTLLVTHDIQEALLLSDTIHVLSSRPASIRGSIAVPVDRGSRRVGNRDLWELEMNYYDKFSARG